MRIVIIGAGLIGLASAYFLQRAGAQVTVVERQPGPGEGTSFANGALLHASLVRPWNAPGIMKFLLTHLGREDSAFLLRLAALPSLMGWGRRFLHESDPARFTANTQKNLRLAQYSLAQMKVLRTDMPELQYQQYFRGSLSVFRSDANAKAARVVADAAQAHGTVVQLLDRDALAALEPALAPIAPQLIGGIHAQTDEAGDAHAFCQSLADALRRRGARFEFGASFSRMEMHGERISGVQVDTKAGTQRFAADAVVLAAGIWSGALARALKIDLPVRPAKGYSITLPAGEPPVAPRIPVLDDFLHCALVPVGTGQLRVAGTAEFAGMDTSVKPARIDNLKRLLRQVYPRVAEATPADAIKPWAGLRPMCADGVPLIGATRIPNLFINTGHGQLGWTLAAGSGSLLADVLMGKVPALAEQDYALGRFAP